jgi:hypothetical protein
MIDSSSPGEITWRQMAAASSSNEEIGGGRPMMRHALAAFTAPLAMR